VVNVVGDQARSHKRLDAPLESDLDGLAAAVSGWLRRSLSPADVAADAAEAVAESARRGIATLVLPADVSWEDGAQPAAPSPARPAPQVPPSVADDVAAVLRVDRDEWLAELPQITEWFGKFGDKLPAVLWSELDALRARLNAA
jgi:acetolactate synthase-1/2/3 large subunit